AIRDVIGALIREAEAAGLREVAIGALHTLSFAHYFREDEPGALQGILRGVELARKSADPLLRARFMASGGRCMAQAETDAHAAAELLSQAEREAAGASIIDIPLGRGLLSAVQGDKAGAVANLEAAAAQ